MTLDFPANPSDGQIFDAPNGVRYIWSAASGLWVVVGLPAVPLAPAAKFYANTNWTWGNTTPLPIAIDTTAYNHGAGTFSTTGAPNGGHLWTPGAGLWSITAAVLVNASQGQAGASFELVKYVGGAGSPVTLAYWAGYFWQNQNSTGLIATDVELAAGDGLQLVVSIGGSIGGFTFVGAEHYIYLAGHRVRP